MVDGCSAWTWDIFQPLLVTTNAIALASETVRMILKIDDIVPVR